MELIPKHNFLGCTFLNWEIFQVSGGEKCVAVRIQTKCMNRMLILYKQVKQIQL